MVCLAVVGNMGLDENSGDSTLFDKNLCCMHQDAIAEVLIHETFRVLLCDLIDVLNSAILAAGLVW